MSVVPKMDKNCSVRTREDSDERFLEEMLNQLYDFGDSGGRKKRKRPKKERLEPVVTDSVAATPAGSGGCVAKVETVTFTGSPGRTSTAQAATPQAKLPKAETKTDNADPFHLEKARLEVRRFGITGFQKDQQRVFEQERAIALGARPPKKEYVNYKVYQQQVKDKKLKKEEARPQDAKKKKREPARDKRKPLSGQVGRFRGGVLLLSSKEIQKIKRSRVVK